MSRSCPANFTETGWAVCEADGSADGRLQIQRIDELEIFPGDVEAIAHVMAKAHVGDPEAREALQRTAGLDRLVDEMSALCPM